MAKIHGKNADISYGGSALESDGNSVTLDISVDTAEVTSFGEAWKGYLEGVADWTISADFFFEPTDAHAADVIFDQIGSGKAALVFYPGGSAVNKVNYAGSAIVTRKGVTTAVGGAATLSVSWQGTGTLVKSGSL